MTCEEKAERAQRIEHTAQSYNQSAFPLFFCRVVGVDADADADAEVKAERRVP